MLLFSTLNFYLLNSVKKQLLDQCKLSHKNFAGNYDQEFYELSQNSILLMDNQTFRSTYYNQTPLAASKNYLLLNIVRTLSSFVATKSYILQAGYVNTVNDRYISSAYTAFLEDFYDNPFYGSVINQGNYLADYQRRGTMLQIQPLDMKNSQVAIPILQYQIGHYSITNPLIIYISKNTFSSSLKNYQITPGTQLFVYSKETDQIIASTNVKQEALVQAQITLNPDHRKITLDHTEYYMFATSSTSGYCDSLLYVTLVPYKDIWDKITSSWILSIVTLLFCCILMVLLCYLFSLRLYSPIKGILHNLSSRSESDSPATDIRRDEFQYLDERIQNLMYSNKYLKDTMTTALPTLYSRYILNILYQEDYDNKKLEPLLADYSFHFPYTYFTCCILIPRYSTAFYNHFTKADQTIIRHQLIDVLQLTQDPSCVKYVFRMEDEQFCIISNSPDPDQTSLLTKDFEAFQDLFSFDADYIKLYQAVGKTHETLQNLHCSWKEANTALAQISTFGDTYLHFYEETEDGKSSYCMSPIEDNKLSNFLFQGNGEDALSLIGSILEKNKEQHVSEMGFKDLYIHFYEIGDNLLRRIGLDGQELMTEHYVNLSTYLHRFSSLQRSDYIKDFYLALCNKQAETNHSNHSLEEIKNYVDQHYCEDIYLESIATVFGTTPKYMSRLLKQALGIPFKQYITTRKIDHSKTLLTETDLRIDMIAATIGFNNRVSFIRTFKQTVGMTPSEYRNLNK